MRLARGVARVLAALGLGLVLALVLSPARTSTRRVPFGFNDNAVTEHVATATETAALLAQIGARIDRVQVDWRSIEPRPGTYSLATYDEIYKADLARGVRPLFVFGFAPQWAAEPSCDAEASLCPPAPDHVNAAAAATATLAERYPRLIGIEIWNEPNTPYFWFPRANVAAYTRLLIACYGAIKHVDPKMPVAGGAISDSPALNAGYISLPDFLRGIYRDGGGRDMDAISIHPYPDPGDISGTTAVDAVQQALSARDASGDHTRPLWVTETGITTTGPGAVNEFEQASALVRLYHLLNNVPDIRMVIFHTLVPPPVAPDNPEAGFSVVRSDFAPKPAFCALSAALGGRRHC